MMRFAKYYIDEELYKTFKQYAKNRGGMCAVIRNLIANELKENGSDNQENKDHSDDRKQIRFSPRFSKSDADKIINKATEFGMLPAQWLRSLALFQIRQSPMFNKDDLAVLQKIFSELLREGQNLNQIARALNISLLEEKPHQINIDYFDRIKDLHLALKDELRRVINNNKAVFGWKNADK